MKNLLNQIRLAIIMGLYISYEITLIIGVILVESIFGHFRNQRERVEEKRKNQIGNFIMDPAQNSKRIL